MDCRGSRAAPTASALTGTGVGVFAPAGNTAVMASVPERVSAAAGGMVNMARGVGTALGIAGVTLALHLAGAASHEAGARAASLVLAAVALLAARTASGRAAQGRVARPGGAP